MVPIHESDVAENRWKVGEWSTVELWEKVELQLRRRKRWTIFAVILLFLILSAIPTVKDRMPKWRSLRMARTVAQEMSFLKLQASQTKQAVQISIIPEGSGLQLNHQFLTSCAPGAGVGSTVTAKPLFTADQMNGLQLLDSTTAAQLGLERVTRQFCFDPVAAASNETKELAAGIIPVSDLTEGRTDRISFVFFRPETSEVSFD